MSQVRGSSGEETGSSVSELSLLEIANRPDYGTKGRPISLMTNYVKLRKDVQGDITVKQHRVDFDGGKIRLQKEDKRRIFWQVVSDNPNVFPDRYGLAFDGDSQLYSLNELGIKADSVFETTVKVQLTRTNRPVECQMMLKRTNEVVLAFKSVKKSTGETAAGEQTAIQVVDVILTQGRSCTLEKASELYCLLGNSAYEMPRQRGAALGLGAELWRGLFLSARVCEGFRPLCNVDLSHAAFYRPQPLMEMICDVLNGDRNQPMYHVNQITKETVLSENEFCIVLRALKNVQISVTHRNTKAVYKVVDMRLRAANTMFKKDDVDISVATYFRDTYHPLRYPNMPVVQVGNKKNGPYIPVEVCVVAQKQKYNKKLTPNQTTLTIRQCAMDAPTRLQKSMEMMRQVNMETDAFLKKFGMRLTPELLEVPGRVIPPPKLLYKTGDGRTTAVEPRDGVWRMQNMQFYEGGKCANYSAILFLRPNMVNQVANFCMRLSDFFRSKGINMAAKPDLVNHVRSLDQLEQTVNDMMKEYERNNRKCHLLYVALSDRSQYPSVKRVCDVRLGVMSQCFMQRVMNDITMKGSVDTMTNIGMKVNAKLGGQNTRISDDYIIKNHLAGMKTLVLGIDVTHPSVGDLTGPSIGAVVGNVDLDCMKYETSVRVQPHRRETVLHLEEQFRQRLKAFSSRNKFKPDRIIIFRDGVAEGQFLQVLKEELRALRQACRTLDERHKPKVTFVVVQKRHHTRFACKNNQDAMGKGRNIPAGTVIDRQITSADGYDFYLCSHAGIQGTSRPAKYHVIYDENNISSDDMQAIAYYLCHTFSRCTRAVSIPAPVYYAHLACFRARHHAHAFFSSTDQSLGSTMSRGGAPTDVELQAAATVHSNLSNRMYFT